MTGRLLREPVDFLYSHIHQLLQLKTASGVKFYVFSDRKWELRKRDELECGRKPLVSQLREAGRSDSLVTLIREPRRLCERLHLRNVRG